jgi:hypothetical protein
VLADYQRQRQRGMHAHPRGRQRRAIH